MPDKEIVYTDEKYNIYIQRNDTNVLFMEGLTHEQTQMIILRELDKFLLLIAETQ